MNYSFLEHNDNIFDHFASIKNDILSSLNESTYSTEHNLSLQFDVQELKNNYVILKELIISEFGRFKIVEGELCMMEDNMCIIEGIEVDVIDEGKVNKIKGEMEQLKLEKNQLLSNISYLLNITKKTDIQEGHTCPVCYKRECNIAMIPCGHVFCKECTLVSKNNICYICRKSDCQYLQLYYT